MVAGTPGFDIERLQVIRAHMDEALGRASAHQRRTTLSGADAYICYVDADGFEGALDDAPALYEAYRTNRQYILASFWEPSAAGSWAPNSPAPAVEVYYPGKLLWPYAFSDSWFFCTTDSSPDALRQISSAAAGLAMRLWDIGLPSRGGIARGPIWWHPEEQIVLGKPLAEAARLAEQLDCFGVAMAESVGDPGPAATTALTCRMHDKGGSWTETRRFAKLVQDPQGPLINSGLMLALFERLWRNYAARQGASPRVVARYENSIQIAREMVGPTPDAFAPS